MGYFSILPPDAEVGQTNMTCPLCEERIGIVQLLRHLEQLGTSPDMITPNSYSNCPNCGGWFFTENAFLTCLEELADTGDSYRSYPFGIAGGQGTNYTHIHAGETRETRLNNLYRGYEIEGGSLVILGAERADVDEEDRLPIDRHEGSFTRVTLADAVLVSITRVAPRKVLISSNMLEQRSEETDIEEGDELTLYYQQNLFQAEATDPPWIQLLREAKTAISQDNPIAACPLLVAAVDNGLFRQVYLHFRLEGNDHDTAMSKVREYGYEGKVGRKDLAGDALEDISGARLNSEKSPYFNEWNKFQRLVDRRVEIIHPTGEPVPEIDTRTAEDWFDLSVDLLLGYFDIVRGQSN